MKMKKFMNAPETVTDEELVGLGLAYPDILNVDGHLVISKDLANADRVTIVTYGGSGHEPAQAGFVGKGMLDIQAVGDIFAAPNGQLVFDAMKMADKGHGVLLLTLNYAGDQLAGKQAMKLAKKAGLNVRQVVTGEEIQYDPNGEDNKRGLAGAVALYHIAAAAAREGKTLEEVAEIAQHYADNMASITGNLNEVMTEEKGSLRNIIANLNSLSQMLKDKEGQIDNILTNVDRFSDSLSQSKFPTAIAEMTQTLDQLNATLNKVNSGEGTIGKFVNDQALYDSLVDASANLSALLHDIKANPKRYINISVFGGGRNRE